MAINGIPNTATMTPIQLAGHLRHLRREEKALAERLNSLQRRIKEVEDKALNESFIRLQKRGVIKNTATLNDLKLVLDCARNET